MNLKLKNNPSRQTIETFLPQRTALLKPVIFQPTTMLKKASHHKKLLLKETQITEQTKNTSLKTTARKPWVLFYLTTTKEEKISKIVSF
jgi:hypothetical protein